MKATFARLIGRAALEAGRMGFRPSWPGRTIGPTRCKSREHAFWEEILGNVEVRKWCRDR